MALLPCPECGREVSERAAACPHCGCPIAFGTAVVRSPSRAPAAPPPVALFSGRAEAVVRGMDALPVAPVGGVARCGHCGSAETQAVPLAYEAGTTVSTARSQTRAVGLTAAGMGVGRAETVTTGQSQGMLAARLAPPVARPTANAAGAVLSAIGVGVLALLAYLFAGRLGLITGGIILGMAYGLAAVLGAFTDGKAVAWNARELPARLASWRRSVVCLRCGAVSDPAAP